MCESLCIGQPINQFAVVCYIPKPLGRFITELRQELVRDCTAQSHITILPPRPLEDPARAREELQAHAAHFSPFEIEIPSITVFRDTSVIYAEVGRGREQFFDMHQALNAGSLAFDEPFQYHPHITLAQNIQKSEVLSLYELALRRWRDAPCTTVLIDTLTFVQNTSSNRWTDLVECDLRSGPISDDGGYGYLDQGVLIR